MLQWQFLASLQHFKPGPRCITGCVWRPVLWWLVQCLLSSHCYQCASCCISLLLNADFIAVDSVVNPYAHLGEVIDDIDCYNSSLPSCTISTTSSDDCLDVLFLQCISGEMDHFQWCSIMTNFVMAYNNYNKFVLTSLKWTRESWWEGSHQLKIMSTLISRGSLWYILYT